jgi:hypothetical protein
MRCTSDEVYRSHSVPLAGMADWQVQYYDTMTSQMRPLPVEHRVAVHSNQPPLPHRAHACEPWLLHE